MDSVTDTEDDVSHETTSDERDMNVSNPFDNVEQTNMELNFESSPVEDHEMPTMKWLPGSWQDGTRKSAFQPYRPTTVLTNLQRGNMPAESSIPEITDVSFHHRAGQGELSLRDIEQETDIDVVDSNELSALMWASAYGQVPTVQLLLQHGAQVDKQGREGETSLLLATSGGHHDVVRLLLAEGADVNHADEIGNTALMYAAHSDQPHCAHELILRDADITLTNICGNTAFGIAVSKKSHLIPDQYKPIRTAIPGPALGVRGCGRRHNSVGGTVAPPPSHPCVYDWNHHNCTTI